MENEPFVFLALLLALLKVVLHELFLTAGLADDATLLVVFVALGRPFQTFLVHTLQHLVGQLEFASRIVRDALTLLVEAIVGEFLYVLEKGLKVAFFHYFKF